MPAIMNHKHKCLRPNQTIPLSFVSTDSQGLFGGFQTWVFIFLTWPAANLGSLMFSLCAVSWSIPCELICLPTKLKSTTADPSQAHLPPAIWLWNMISWKKCIVFKSAEVHTPPCSEPASQEKGTTGACPPDKGALLLIWSWFSSAIGPWRCKPSLSLSSQSIFITVLPRQ